MPISSSIILSRYLLHLVLLFCFDVPAAKFPKWNFVFSIASAKKVDLHNTPDERNAWELFRIYQITYIRKVLIEYSDASIIHRRGHLEYATSKHGSAT